MSELLRPDAGRVGRVGNCQYHVGFVVDAEGMITGDKFDQPDRTNVSPACFECACAVSEDPSLLTSSQAYELEEFATSLRGLDALSAASFCYFVQSLKEWT